MRLLRTRGEKDVKEIGADAKVHWTTIYKWERKTKSWKDLPFERVERWAHALGLSVDEVTNGGQAA